MFLRGSLRLVRWVAVAAFSVAATPCVVAAQEWTPLIPVSDYYALAEAPDTDPKIAVDELGNSIAIWLAPGQVGDDPLAPDIHVFSTFTDGTRSEHPSLLNLDAATNKGIVAADVVYAGENTWLCLWVTVPGGGVDGQIFMAQSYNNGLTWSSPSVLYTGPVDHEVDVASDTAGTVIATFRTRLLRSTDYGSSWDPITEPLEVIPNFPETTVKGLLEARIATNGMGTWIHAYSAYWGTFDRHVQIYARTSTDNGLTWTGTLADQTLSQQDNVLGDVAMRGDMAVVAHRYFQTPSVFVSTNGGADWSSRVTVFTPLLSGYAGKMWLAVNDNQWTLVNRDMLSSRLEYFTATDPISWTAPKFVTTDMGANESDAALATLPNGDVLALVESDRQEGAPDDTDIYETRLLLGGMNPPAEPAADLAVSSPKALKLKVNWKKGTSKLTWKVTVSNVGELDAGGSVVRFWFSHDDVLDNSDVLLSEEMVKPINAAKPGKKPKKRMVKLKIEPPMIIGRVIAEVISPGERVGTNNFTAMSFNGVH